MQKKTKINPHPILAPMLQKNVISSDDIIDTVIEMNKMNVSRNYKPLLKQILKVSKNYIYITLENITQFCDNGNEPLNALRLKINYHNHMNLDDLKKDVKDLLLDHPAFVTVFPNDPYAFVDEHVFQYSKKEVEGMFRPNYRLVDMFIEDLMKHFFTHADIYKFVPKVIGHIVTHDDSKIKHNFNACYVRFERLLFTLLNNN